jgi:ADP-ribose pyrophosphatase YjhB (NUDIX family)
MLASFFNTLARIFYKLAYKLILFVWFFYKPTVKGVYIAVWCDKKILIIKNSYRKQFTIPCGRIKRGENLTEAAVRELSEEVSLKVYESELKFIGQYKFNYKYVSEIGNFFELEISNLPNISVDNREVVWARFTAPDKALLLELNPLVRSYLGRRETPQNI